MFDSLGELLVQIELLREEQWQEVRQRLTPDADLHAVLNSIQELPAWWMVGGSAPALTAYQRKWINRLYEKGRLTRLKRALRRENYLMLQELGEGGTGIVYKAWDIQEKHLVAVKKIKKVSKDAYRRLRREAHIQKRLTCPFIVRFLKLVRTPCEMLLVQEYIDGRTIAEEVKARGPIPWQEAVRWTLDILRALEYAHRLKIIHRDLKPSNIILHRHAEGAAAKLLDLGLAKCLDSTRTQTTTDAMTVAEALLGTFEYMAPEQWRGAAEVLPASDIYSLGCTLFYILTGGHPPFVADSLAAYCNAHTSTPPPRLSASLPVIPDVLDSLVQQMLSKVPAKRGTPMQLIKQFSNLLRPKSAMASLSSAVPPARQIKSDSLPYRLQPPESYSAHTPIPQQPLSLPRLKPLPVDERFTPFSSDVSVPVWGVRHFLRAFLVSHGLMGRIFSLIFIAITVIGILWLLISI